MTSPEPNPKVAALTGQAPAEPADAKRPGTWPLSAADLDQPPADEPTPVTLQVPPELGDVVEDLGVVRAPAPRPRPERDELAEAQADFDRVRAAIQSVQPPVLPVYTAWLTVARGGPDEEAPDVLYQATISGPAEFVERAVSSAADAFRDHAER